MEIIKVENISKKYRISHQGSGMTYSTLRDELTSVIKRPLNWVTGKTRTKEDVWVLDDVSFEVNRGEILGLIGLNGAGKSTLLKILTRITPPTKGRAIIRGRVGSLLEVGTGFHPELTGRENIYLNGSILGMKKSEIDKKFDEIVDFAEIEKFLDTPAKRYSSGMYVRLAFSVAACLETDILLVDEVLSVGDVMFQKKSFDKMQEITRKSGRTIIFVSHNMGAVKSLCNKTILLEKGKMIKIGNTEEVIDHYLDSGILSQSTVEYQKDQSKEMQIKKVTVLDCNEKPSIMIDVKDPFSIEVEYDSNKPLKNIVLSMHIFSTDGSWVLVSVESENREEDYITLFKEKREIGKYLAKVKFPANLLNKGTYQFKFIISLISTYYDEVDNIYVSFYDSGSFYQKYQTERGGLITVPLDWETKKI